jgi:hypothetical protein
MCQGQCQAAAMFQLSCSPLLGGKFVSKLGCSLRFSIHTRTLTCYFFCFFCCLYSTLILQISAKFRCAKCMVGAFGATRAMQQQPCNEKLADCHTALQPPPVFRVIQPKTSENTITVRCPSNNVNELRDTSGKRLHT